MPLSQKITQPEKIVPPQEKAHSEKTVPFS
jgi:hypothetical protein